MKNPPLGWSDQGLRVYMTNTTKEDYTVTFTGKPPSAHVKITLIPGEDVKVRRIVFGEDRVRIVDTIRTWTRAELATAFDCRREEDITDMAFAQSRKAKLGVRIKFVRTDDYLIIVGHETERGKGDISIRLTDKIRCEVEKFLKSTHQVPVHP